MWSTKLCVPGGTLVQARAGDTCSPAWVYFTGICAPSANAVVVKVSGGRAGAAGWPAGAWASTGAKEREGEKGGEQMSTHVVVL